MYWVVGGGGAGRRAEKEVKKRTMCLGDLEEFRRAGKAVGKRSERGLIRTPAALGKERGRRGEGERERKEEQVIGECLKKSGRQAKIFKEKKRGRAKGLQAKIVRYLTTSVV
jgi:hypothetical protein